MGEQVFGEFTVVGTWASVTPVYNNNWAGALSIVPQVGGAGRTKPDRRLTKEDAAKIRTELEGALAARGKCRDFLNATLRNLGSDFKDIKDVFDLYAQKGKIYDAPSIGDGEASFPAKSPRAKLRLGLAAIRSRNELESVAFHELVHGSGRTASYSHEDMAEAMYAAAKSMGIELENAPVRPDKRKLNSKNPLDRTAERWRVGQAADKVWSEAEKKACGGK